MFTGSAVELSAPCAPRRTSRLRQSLLLHSSQAGQRKSRGRAVLPYPPDFSIWPTVNRVGLFAWVKTRTEFANGLCGNQKWKLACLRNKPSSFSLNGVVYISSHKELCLWFIKLSFPILSTPVLVWIFLVGYTQITSIPYNLYGQEIRKT